MRVRLNKQGFSEIAIFSAAARHCEENSIKPSAYVSDMVKLIDGCGRDLFFPKTHNDFHYLRGQYHDIRHGNLERGEGKSPEQRGLFLCNTCYQVKTKNDRSKNANEKHTCTECKSEKAKEYYANKKVNKENDIPTEIEDEPQIQENVIETNSCTSDSQASENTSIKEPSMTNIAEKTEEKPKQEKKSFAHLLGTQTPSKIELTEVIADSKGATITINCPTANLYLVLSSLSELTG